MPGIEWNIKTWNESYSWKDQGEEWSNAWGGSEAQWFGSLLPRIHRFIPCNNVLEIACGYGRWTKFFLPLTFKKFIGIDMTENCIEYCKNKFQSDKASFYQNDGYSLRQVEEIKFDFIFSFDSLVHADTNVLDSYIKQILELLTEDGICFLHHSNLGQILSQETNNIDHPGLKHNRDQSSSAHEVKNIVNKYGGKVVLQELINWGCDSTIDCITLFSQSNSRYNTLNDEITNKNFMKEAENCRKIFQLYNV